MTDFSVSSVDTFQMPRSTRFPQCSQQPCVYHVYKNGLCKKHEVESEKNIPKG